MAKSLQPRIFGVAEIMKLLFLTLQFTYYRNVYTNQITKLVLYSLGHLKIYAIVLFGFHILGFRRIIIKVIKYFNP